MSGLSLTLAYVGSYMYKTIPNVKDYIRCYEEVWEKFYKNKITQLKDYFRSILFTYIIFYKYMQRNNTSAAKLLNLFTYFDCLDLWYSLFISTFDKNIVSKEMLFISFLFSMKTEFNFTQKIQILLNYFLIETRY